ncbi:TPA: O-antigen polymerase [Vibrio parahaemolyticus]
MFSSLGFISVAWVFIWSTLAFLNVSGNGDISIYLYVYILTYLFFFSISYCGVSVYLSEKSLNFKNKVLSRNLINYFGIVVFIILLILSFKAYNLMTSMYIWDYRSKAFGDATEASVLFGSQINRILYSLLVEGGVYFLQYYYLSRYFISGSVRSLLLGGLFVTLMCFIMLGRSPLYYYLLISIFIYFRRNPRNIIRVSILSIVSFLLLYFATYFRSGGGIDLISFINQYLVGYHTYGFNLLNYRIDFTKLESLWFGQAFLGSFSYFTLYSFEKVFDLNILYFMDEAYTIKQDFVLLESGQEANAFYTIFYDMFKDFFWLGPLLYGLIIGAVFSFFNRLSLVSKNIYVLMTYFWLVNISFAVIFRNPLATNGYVGFIIYLVVFYFISHARLRK